MPRLIDQFNESYLSEGMISKTAGNIVDLAVTFLDYIDPSQVASDTLAAAVAAWDAAAFFRHVNKIDDILESQGLPELAMAARLDNADYAEFIKAVCSMPENKRLKMLKALKAMVSSLQSLVANLIKAIVDPTKVTTTLALVIDITPASLLLLLSKVTGDSLEVKNIISQSVGPDHADLLSPIEKGKHSEYSLVSKLGLFYGALLSDNDVCVTPFEEEEEEIEEMPDIDVDVVDQFDDSDDILTMSEIMSYGRRGYCINEGLGKASLKLVPAALKSAGMAIPGLDIVIGTFIATYTVSKLRDNTDDLVAELGISESQFVEAIEHEDSAAWEEILLSIHLHDTESLKDIFDEVLGDLKSLLLTFIQSIDSVLAAAGLAAAGVGAIATETGANITTAALGFLAEMIPLERWIFTMATSGSQEIDDVIEMVNNAGPEAESELTSLGENGGSILLAVIKNPRNAFIKLGDFYRALHEPPKDIIDKDFFHQSIGIAENDVRDFIREILKEAR
tara:strand:+ start:318 stop:1838 length:1521 start_codon:yes stop_codon:yes gene_type:complete